MTRLVRSDSGGASARTDGLTLSFLVNRTTPVSGHAVHYRSCLRRLSSLMTFVSMCLCISSRQQTFLPTGDSIRIHTGKCIKTLAATLGLVGFAALVGLLPYAREVIRCPPARAKNAR